MTDDYVSAGLRHYFDSTMLAGEGRVDNSAYLGGYVMECALKALLQVHGYGPRAYRHDLNALSAKGLALASMLSPGMSRYRVDRVPRLSEAIIVWKPEMRYAETGAVSPSDATLVLEVAKAMVSEVIVPLLLDGRGKPK
jgi:hypothetical protein